MKLFICFICFILTAFVQSELHTFLTTLTAIRGKTTEFYATTTLNGKQIGYYDSEQMMLVPKQDWKEEIKSKAQWTENNVIRENVQRIYNNNIHALMQHLHQSEGVQTFQGMFGCSWDNETGDSHGFNDYGYNEEDFITLDMKSSKYSASVSRAESIVEEWNKNKSQLSKLMIYYENECVYQAKDFVFFTEAAFRSTEPQISLLLKNSDLFVDCHVTGLHANNTAIGWTRNGQDMNSSALVKSGDTLPNEDGTFQRNVTLSVLPDDRKKHQYSCVVKHMGKTIQKTLTEDEIKTNKLTVTSAAYAPIVYVVIPVLIILVLIIVSGLIYKYRTQIHRGYQAVKAIIDQH